MKKQQKYHVPIDGGWGWFVALGAFLNNTFTVGQLQCYGVFMLEIENAWGTSAALTQWVNAIAYGLSFIMAPITSTLCNVFGFQIIALIGGCVAGIGMSLCFFVQDLSFLFVTYGIIYGIGVAMVYVPAMTMLGYYFHQRLALATGIAIMGASVGSLVLPIIIEAMIEQYSYSGAFLFMGGLTFNLMVAGALFRPTPGPAPPPEWYELHTALDLHRVESKRSLKLENFATSSETDMSAREVTLQELKNREKKIQEKMDRVINEDPGKKKKFNFAVFKNVKLDIFTISTVLAMISYSNIYLLLPRKTQELRHDDPDAKTATFVSFTSLVECIMRPIWGFVWDRPYFRNAARRRQLGYCITLAATGISLIIGNLVSTEVWMYLWCAAVGIFLSGYLTPIFVIIVDIVGAKSLTDAIGGMLLAQTFAVTTGPLVTGILIDNTGDSDAAFVFMGCSMIAGSFLFLTVVFCRETRTDLELDTDNKDLSHRNGIVSYPSQTPIVESEFIEENNLGF